MGLFTSVYIHIILILYPGCLSHNELKDSYCRKRLTVCWVLYECNAMYLYVMFLFLYRCLSSFQNSNTREETQMIVPTAPAGISGTALAASLLRDGWSVCSFLETCFIILLL